MYTGAYKDNPMDIDCIEIERRLAIGFNEQLSLAARHRLVMSGLTLDEISGQDAGFRPYIRETRDVIHWLSRSPHNSIIWYGEESFPSFNPLRGHLPYMLMCSGTRPDTSIPCVGIVGTRHATYAALQEAFRFGMEAVSNGMSVVSGFAEGIDQAGMTWRRSVHGYTGVRALRGVSVPHDGHEKEDCRCRGMCAFPLCAPQPFIQIQLHITQHDNSGVFHVSDCRSGPGEVRYAQYLRLRNTDGKGRLRRQPGCRRPLCPSWHHGVVQ